MQHIKVAGMIEEVSNISHPFVSGVWLTTALALAVHSLGLVWFVAAGVLPVGILWGAAWVAAGYGLDAARRTARVDAGRAPRPRAIPLGPSAEGAAPEDGTRVMPVFHAPRPIDPTTPFDRSTSSQVGMPSDPRWVDLPIKPCRRRADGVCQHVPQATSRSIGGRT
jgi:hypothetical protein